MARRKPRRLSNPEVTRVSLAAWKNRADLNGKTAGQIAAALSSITGLTVTRGHVVKNLNEVVDISQGHTTGRGANYTGTRKLATLLRCVIDDLYKQVGSDGPQSDQAQAAFDLLGDLISGRVSLGQLSSEAMEGNDENDEDQGDEA